MSNTAKTDDTFRVIKKFTPETCEKINYYVYRLIDPRNGNTFYVGKGKDNRVFAHAAAATISPGGGYFIATDCAGMSVE